MDKTLKKIYEAFRKSTARLAEIPEDRQDDALGNIKLTDLAALLDALDAALAAAPKSAAAPKATA